MIYILLLVLQLIFLFFITKFVTKKLFILLRRISSNDNFVFSLISLIYLPGTIVHEFGHFITAMVLFLKIIDINIFPRWKKNQIKLGSVVYEKKDYLRSIIVGIAPLFSGLFFLFLVAYFNLIATENIFINIFFLYLIFAVSSTMFSSKQDLKDIVFIIPLIIIFTGIIYVFNIDLKSIISHTVLTSLIIFSQKVNFYLLISVIINLSLIILVNFFSLFIR